MKVGLYFDLRNPPAWEQPWSRVYGFALELCEEVDRLGGDSVWFSEHHRFADGYLPQPLTFAAAAAARTTRVRIGTSLVVAPLRSPAQLAEEAAVVDIISDGRLDLGLGPGYLSADYELFGVTTFNRRYTETDRRVTELRRLWSGPVTPPPVQQPVPIWLGYQGPQGARRAGRLGVGLLSLNPELAAPYRAGLAESALDPALARMSGAVWGWITEDPERDWPAVSRHLAHQADSYRHHMAIDADAPRPKPIDPVKWRARGVGAQLGHFLLATPDDAAREILDFVGDAPVDTVLFWASIANTSEEMTAEHVRLVCERLAPLVADGLSTQPVRGTP